MCTETVQVCTGDSNSGPGDSVGVLVGKCPTKFSWSGQQCSEGNSFLGGKWKQNLVNWEVNLKVGGCSKTKSGIFFKKEGV